MKASEPADSNTTEAHYARAFAELIEDTLTAREECSPVSDYTERTSTTSSMCPLHEIKGSASFPELQAFKDGRDILLTSNEDIGTMLYGRYVKGILTMMRTY